MMNNLQVFFRKIFRSCYDVEWFREVRTLTVGAGLRYVALLHVVIALGTTTAIAPAMVAVRNDIRTFASEQLPPDGFLAVADGVLTSNFPQPYERKAGDLTIIVDPSYESAEFPASITSKDPVLFLGKRATFVQVDPDDRRVQANDLKTKGRVTTTDVVNALDKVPAIAVWFISLVAALFYALFLFAANAGFAWVSAYLLVFLGKKWGAPLPRDRWLVVSLFAITLPTLVDASSVFLGLRTPFLFTGLFILVITAVFIDEKNQPTTPTNSVIPANAGIHTPSQEPTTKDDKPEDANEKTKTESK